MLQCLNRPPLISDLRNKIITIFQLSSLSIWFEKLDMYTMINLSAIIIIFKKQNVYNVYFMSCQKILIVTFIILQEHELWERVCIHLELPVYILQTLHTIQKLMDSWNLKCLKKGIHIHIRIQWIIPKKTGFNIYQSRRCADKNLTIHPSCNYINCNYIWNYTSNYTSNYTVLELKI